ncbi:MAG: MurR/RpiR family transcriptional regulator [Thermomicrobiales bacterium]|nr:MurR/RpiR family transcriptional regulator [Thermomicrobiales bacterium]
MEPAPSLVDRISERFGEMTPKQQRVSRYFADHPAEVAFTSANELAKRLEVDPATVVRLSRILGYQGYPDLQRHLRAHFPHHYPALTRQAGGAIAHETMPDVLRQTFVQDAENLRFVSEQIDVQVFDQIVDRLLNAERILVFGSGVATGVVSFLASSFRTIGLVATQVTESGLTLVQETELLTDRDLAFGVAFYRYVRETLTALDRTRELGVPSVVLTDSPVSPAAPLANYALVAPVESLTHRISLVAPMAMVNALLAACVARGGARPTEMLERIREQYRKAGLLIYE